MGISGERVVLIGAGSASFTRGLLADLIGHDWDCELALVDINPEALAVAEGLVRKMIEATGARIRLSADTDRRAVLPGATAVICTIGVGGRRAWEQDVLLPRKYGIFQPVGDSVMPGGTSRALRMIPAMVAIASDILDLCPEALFFNYANPMTPICRAVRKATGADVVGLCHGVFNTAGSLTSALGLTAESVHYTAVGMNHLTWFTDVLADDEDVMPRLRSYGREQIGRHMENLGRDFAEAGRTAEDEVRNPFCWELLELLDAYPAPGDRHVCEFFPHMFKKEGAYYGKTLGVDAYSFEDCISWGDKGYAEMKELGLSPTPLPDKLTRKSGGEHEQVIEIIESIRQDREFTYSVNLPNCGQVPNLPADAVIESPAMVTQGGLCPIDLPFLSPAIAATLATRLQWVETVVESALEGSVQKFVQALLVDGAVDSIAMAEKLADELLQAHREHLPQFQA